MTPPPRNKPKILTAPARKPAKADGAIHFQQDLIGIEPASEAEAVYTTKIKAPIYKPGPCKPNIIELVNLSKTRQLIAKIQGSDLPDYEKQFLIEAARRHSVFNYQLIADYYAHSSAAMQHFMEDSALVIIDFTKAIENGYIDYNEEIEELYKRETGNK